MKTFLLFFDDSILCIKNIYQTATTTATVTTTKNQQKASVFTYFTVAVFFIIIFLCFTFTDFILFLII